MTATRRLGVRAAIVGGGRGRVAEVRLSPVGREGPAVPGFVDLQVNGFAGVDVAAADLNGCRRMASALAATGVTACQPTLVSLPRAPTRPG